MSALYPLGKLARQLEDRPHDARLSRDDHEKTRHRKVDEWKTTLLNMVTGCLNVGSRRPSAYPEWVTLKVLDGGFTTGEPLATLSAEDRPNEYFLSGDGADRLAAMADSGRFRAEMTEHFALMAVVWLVRRGQVSEAEAILRQIRPYFGKLRFYPYEADTPVDVSPLVCVESVQDVRNSLEQTLKNITNITMGRIRKVVVYKRAITSWLPLKWQMLSLFAKTVKCEHAPAYVTNGSGKIVATNGKPLEGSGWKPQYWAYPAFPCQEEQLCGQPFQCVPDNFQKDAQALQAKVDDLMEAERVEGCRLAIENCRAWPYRHSVQPTQPCEYCEPPCMTYGAHKKKSLVTLLEALRVCGEDGPTALTGKQVGLCRSIIAGWNTKHGLPGSERFERWWSTVVASIPSSEEGVLGVLLERLSRFDGDRGLTMAEYTSLVSDCADKVVSRSLRKRIRRARVGTLKEHIDGGIVPSSEVLANLIPQISAEATSAGEHDQALRRLNYALRLAFRRRRSVLLLNLDRQVRLEDIPWSSAIVGSGNRTDGAKGTALATLKLVVRETLIHFPHTILPNKLLQSLRELAKEAGLSLGLTDELASDIFMGRLSRKFGEAAKIAADVLVDTPYAVYFKTNRMYHMARSRNIYTPSELLADCGVRSGLGPCSTDCQSWGWGWGSPLTNASGLEWVQIITSHNLAVLRRDLHLDEEIEWNTLVLTTWLWILRALSRCPTDPYSSKMQNMKTIAFAWRQLIFFFSMIKSAERGASLTTMEGEMRTFARDLESTAVLRKLFIYPLRLASEGESPGTPITGLGQGECLLDEAVYSLKARSGREGAPMRSDNY